MTPAERQTLDHRAEVRRMRNQSLRLTRGQVAAYAAACLVAMLALAVLAGCTTIAPATDGDDWDEQCRNPITGEGAGVPIYGSDC